MEIAFLHTSFHSKTYFPTWKSWQNCTWESVSKLASLTYLEFWVNNNQITKMLVASSFTITDLQKKNLFKSLFSRHVIYLWNNLQRKKVTTCSSFWHMLMSGTICGDLKDLIMFFFILKKNFSNSVMRSYGNWVTVTFSTYSK